MGIKIHTLLAVWVLSACGFGAQPKPQNRHVGTLVPAETTDTNESDGRDPTDQQTGGPLSDADVEDASDRGLATRSLDSRPLIAAVGGWNSCVATSDDSRPNPRGMNLYQPFMSMIDDLTAEFDDKPYFAVSCFQKTLESLSFITSESNRRLEMTPDTYFRHLTQLAKELDAPLVLLGQSYGGWFVMDYVHRQAGLNDVSMLITVDPISPVGCDPTEFGQIILSRLTFDFSAPTECGQSSSDIGPGARQTITEKVSRWHNLYQFDAFRILHGTPLAEASVNTKIDHQSISDALNGHIAMGKNPATWNAIAAEIKQAISP